MTSEILLVYAAKPSGHQKAAESIRMAIKNINPKVCINELDFFTDGYPILGPAIASLYLEVVQKVPNLWNQIYNGGQNLQNSSREARGFFNFLQLPKIRSYLKKYKPSVIVSTHAATSGILAVEKTLNKSSNFFLSSVVTDFGTHDYWPQKGVDAYFVPTDEVKSEFIKMGISREKIEVTGIPVNPEFSLSSGSTESVYQEFMLKKNIFTVLVMGGSHGLGGVEKIIETINKSGALFQTLVVCGHNEFLYKNLLKNYSQLPYVKIIKYTRKVHKLMEVSDVLITKAGGITIAEAAHKELPLIIFNPLPAQEEKNTRYLLKRKAAIYCKNTEELSTVLKKFAIKPTKLSVYRDKIKNIMFLDGSKKIARYILRELNVHGRA